MDSNGSILPGLEVKLISGALFLYLLTYVADIFMSVFFGPLSKFPGPKLAAVTSWYEFYYDVILKGRYTFKIKEMHQKYGEIFISVPSLLRSTCVKSRP
jgi:hypothetical protein